MATPIKYPENINVEHAYIQFKSYEYRPPSVDEVQKGLFEL